MYRMTVTVLFIFLAVSRLVYAQTPVCAADVLLDLARAASACYGLGNEEACVGTGSVVATNQADSPLSAFALAGERSDINTMRQVTTQIVNGEVALAFIQVQANLIDLEARQIMLVPLGDTTLTNEVSPLVHQVAYARGTANIRVSPQPDAEIVEKIGVNESLVVNGRTSDNRWLRAQLRNTNAVGWVAADVITVENINVLSVVDATSVVQRAYEVMTLATGDAALCEGHLPSGLLLQTPGSDASITMTINDVQVELAGTFFVQANPTLTVYALAGKAVIDDIFLPAGALVSVSDQSVVGYDSTVLTALPLASLPTFVQITAPLTAAQITQATDDYVTALAAASATPVPVPVQVDNSCRRFVRRDVSLYAGPGDFYEAINELQAGTSVDPIFQTTDPQGATWYQLRSSNWIPARQVVEEGNCAEIPVTTNVESPRSNTLSLETCQTTNGPLRGGQTVTIQFTPAPWNNYGEARDAAIIDPGRIIIGAQRFRPSATQPVLIAGTIGEDDERWLRQFFLIWEAVPGTHRIEGYRLSYNPICTITVPVG